MIENFNIFLPKVLAGVSTRLGGSSQGPYSSLNLGYNTQDRPADIENNWRHFKRYWNSDQWVTAQQCHGNHIETVSKPGYFIETDGFITNSPRLVLCVTIADCFPVYYYNEASGYIGLAHCGWRGINQNIHIEMVKQLREHSLNTSHIKVIMGPGICRHHFEVKSDVSKFFKSDYVTNAADKQFIDLPKLIYDDLIASGIKKENLFDRSECTFCMPEKYFSYRREKGTTGRMVASIMLL